MKAAILAGGEGTRLKPLTNVTNKCLLPVYDQPMIYYPIQTLVNSGIKDILLVCGGNSAGEFVRILGNGENFGIKNLNYAYQSKAKGIADALLLAEEWAGNSPITVILADNIFENPIPDVVSEFDKNPDGATLFLTEVEHPECYGVVELDDSNAIIGIEEKPKQPKSNLISAGLYIYDSSVWNRIKNLKPSSRNELEITDLNSTYLRDNKLQAHKIKGWWADAGESLDGYTQVCYEVRKLRKGI